MRYVTTERRDLSPKEPPPEGLRRRRPIGRVARQSRGAQAMLLPRALPLNLRRLNRALDIRALDISDTAHQVLPLYNLPVQR
jgi:hypothetical protein